MLVFKHEVLLTFVGRLTHDHEFREWFAEQPAAALASHGLTTADLEDLAGVLATDRHERATAAALRPTVQLLLDLVAEAELATGAGPSADRLARLQAELRAARERLELARAQRPRPWWKFW